MTNGFAQDAVAELFEALAPKPPRDEVGELKELRRQRRLLEAKAQLAHARRTNHLLETFQLFGDGWGSIVDPRDSLLGDPGFRPVRSPVSLTTDRMRGMEWPIWRT